VNGETVMWPRDGDPCEHVPSYYRILRWSSACEIFQDFQNHIYQRTKAPSSVIIPDEEGTTILRCSPREPVRGAASFCQVFLGPGTTTTDRSQCSLDGEREVLDKISSERQGRDVKWGWRTCHMGLTDCLIPIRTVEAESRRPVLAVLKLGSFRLPGEEPLRKIHSRVDAVTSGADAIEYFPDLSAAERLDLAERLHAVVDDIPVLHEETKVWIDQQLEEVLAMMEIVATRVLHRGLLFEGQRFIEGLGLEDIDVTITENTLWQRLHRPLQQVLRSLPFSSAVLYSSRLGDRTEMKREVTVPAGLDVAKSIGWKEFSDFEWVSQRDAVDMAEMPQHLSWLDAMTYFGADSAILFAREMIGDRLLLLGFGYDREAIPTTMQRALLYEAVNSKILRSVETALFGVSLDRLMAEAGHLMGRAYGKVAVGARTIMSFFPRTNLADADEEEALRSAFWALEDGVMRLRLIHLNFYAFSGRRLGIDLGSAEGVLGDVAEQWTKDDTPTEGYVDVVGVLKGLRPFFIRAIKESRITDLHFLCPRTSARVRGRQERLELVFINLFDNAVKFGYLNTYIEIRVSVTPHQCRVEFENLGIGVAPDETVRVFKPLVKSRYRDRQRKTEGLGLGLSYCESVVRDECGGTIRLTSTEAMTPSLRRFPGDNWKTVVVVEFPLAGGAAEGAQ
jgi:hypothetical protein